MSKDNTKSSSKSLVVVHPPLLKVKKKITEKMFNENLREDKIIAFQ
jgi:hypothetical protein